MKPPRVIHIPRDLSMWRRFPHRDALVPSLERVGVKLSRMPHDRCRAAGGSLRLMAALIEHHGDLK